jgi:hypothetical protein
MSTGYINTGSVFDMIGKTTNLDLWGGSGVDWVATTPHIHEPSTLLPSGSISYYSAPISFFHWSANGSIAIESLFWKGCLGMMMRI